MSPLCDSYCWAFIQKGKLELKNVIREVFYMVSGLCLFLMVFRAAGLIGVWFNRIGIGSSLIMLLQFTFVIVTFITIASGIYVFGQNYIRDKK